jgi:hypothetical protein
VITILISGAGNDFELKIKQQFSEERFWEEDQDLNTNKVMYKEEIKN